MLWCHLCMHRDLWRGCLFHWEGQKSDDDWWFTHSCVHLSAHFHPVIHCIIHSCIQLSSVSFMHPVIFLYHSFMNLFIHPYHPPVHPVILCIIHVSSYPLCHPSIHLIIYPLYYSVIYAVELSSIWPINASSYPLCISFMKPFILRCHLFMHPVILLHYPSKNPLDLLYLHLPSLDQLFTYTSAIFQYIIHPTSQSFSHVIHQLSNYYPISLSMHPVILLCHPCTSYSPMSSFHIFPLFVYF